MYCVLHNVPLCATEFFETFWLKTQANGFHLLYYNIILHIYYNIILHLLTITGFTYYTTPQTYFLTQGLFFLFHEHVLRQGHFLSTLFHLPLFASATWTVTCKDKAGFCFIVFVP